MRTHRSGRSRHTVDRAAIFAAIVDFEVGVEIRADGQTRYPDFTNSGLQDVQMKRVTGIGGAFVKATNPKSLGE